MKYKQLYEISKKYDSNLFNVIQIWDCYNSKLFDRKFNQKKLENVLMNFIKDEDIESKSVEYTERYIIYDKKGMTGKILNGKK